MSLTRYFAPLPSDPERNCASAEVRTFNEAGSKVVRFQVGSCEECSVTSQRSYRTRSMGKRLPIPSTLRNPVDSRRIIRKPAFTVRGPVGAPFSEIRSTSRFRQSCPGRGSSRATICERLSTCPETGFPASAIRLGCAGPFMSRVEDLSEEENASRVADWANRSG